MSWITTPFGDAWIGPGPRPADPPKVEPPPPPPAFVPSYETATVTLNTGLVTAWSVNQWCYATQATAEEVMRRLGGLAVVEERIDVQGPFIFEPPSQRFIVFGAERQHQMTTFKVNAGLLASYWTRNPEDQFPNVAQRLAQAAVKAAAETLLGPEQ